MLSRFSPIVLLQQGAAFLVLLVCGKPRGSFDRGSESGGLSMLQDMFRRYLVGGVDVQFACIHQAACGGWSGSGTNKCK